MIDVAELKKLFNEKLAETGSMDAAFTKSVWVAYKAGIADGKEEVTEEKPLFGNRKPHQSKTHWLLFMKGAQ